MGAQWIHGEQGNPLHEWASRHHLLAESFDCGDERTGVFCTQKGQILDSDMVSSALHRLDEIKDELTIGLSSCSRDHDNQLEPDSVGRSFHEKYQLFVNGKKDDDDDDVTDHQLLWSIFDWYMVFENIDNACDDLSQLSLTGFSEWVDCPGVKLINFQNGYESVLHSFLQEIPNDWLKLNRTVRGISLNHDDQENNDQRITIETDHELFHADHVIMTISLGCLKSCLKQKQFFHPALPLDKCQLISSLGFGTINKIFLKFQERFWTQSNFAVRFIWTGKKNDGDSKEFPSWVHHISGFDAARGHDDVLVGWVGGQGAKDIESETDESIGKHCVKLLRSFLRSYNTDQRAISDPILTICTRWYSNPHSRGSYSHRTIDCDQTKIPFETLYEPITCDHGYPRIMFAGEATDKEFYSSTHGAFRSGLREAQRLIQHYSHSDWFLYRS